MAKCANCGWDWFKHGSKNQCPVQPKRGPNDPKQRFKRLERKRAGGGK
jgi:hypothetical protein